MNFKNIDWLLKRNGTMMIAGASLMSAVRIIILMISAFIFSINKVKEQVIMFN
jgi:hypothetical protein